MLRRESVHAIATLRKELDSLKQDAAEQNKVIKELGFLVVGLMSATLPCTCGKPATHMVRETIGGKGGIVWDRPRCDLCHRPKARAA